MSLKDLLSVPTYTVELPSNKEKISFRPFLVKEEKVLLIAKETKDIREVYNCIKTVLENCITSPKNIDVNKLCYFDVEYLFLKLRSKSMGEMIEILVTDPETKQKFETQLDLEKVVITNFSKNKNKIKLNDTLAVEVQHPSFQDFMNISSKLIESKLESKDRIEFLLDVLTVCLKKVYFKDSAVDCSTLDKTEIREFIDSLPKKEFDVLSETIENFPRIEYQGSFTNPTTGKSFPVEVSDFTNFFT
jgi:hypothetical protein